MTERCAAARLGAAGSAGGRPPTTDTTPTPHLPKLTATRPLGPAAQGNTRNSTRTAAHANGSTAPRAGGRPDHSQNDESTEASSAGVSV